MIRPTAIIAEDEENLRISLRIMLQQLWPELYICGEAGNGGEAMDIINREDPDYVFLDIKMPELSGLEIAKKISGNPKVIFVTAYDQYAVQAFENEAIDYVLKPINEERLKKTISRLKRRAMAPITESHFNTKIEKIINIIEDKEPVQKLHLIKVKMGAEIQFVPVSYICFFKAEYKYTTVQTSQKEFIIKMPVKELESRLDSDHFWRVHRSAIINIDKIHKIKRTATNGMVVTFANTDKTVAVSKAYEHRFKHM